MDSNFWYGIIKEYYDLGLYIANDLDVFVQAKWITADEKTQITGNTTTV
jgi:uncharacterized XkdX family phage protein